MYNQYQESHLTMPLTINNNSIIIWKEEGKKEREKKKEEESYLGHLGSRFSLLRPYFSVFTPIN